MQLALTQAAALNIELHAGRDGGGDRHRQAVPVETESNAIGRNLDAKVFQALPTGRNYAVGRPSSRAASTRTTPNVASSPFTVYGSTGLENAYLVDGANTTGVEIGNQGKVLNFEFIQEVELKAGGYEAEYGGAQGGILNVVTKSGGNEYHGDVFGYFDNDGLQANNKHLASRAPGPSQLHHSGNARWHSRRLHEAGLRGGRRRLHSQGLALVLRRLRPREQHPDGRSRQGDDRGHGRGPRSPRATSTPAKLTWNFGQGQTLVGTVFGDPTDDNGAVGRSSGRRRPTTARYRSAAPTSAARYQGILGPKWLVTGQFVYHRENVNTLPGPGGNQSPTMDATGGTAIATGGFVRPDGDGQFARRSSRATTTSWTATTSSDRTTSRRASSYERVDARRLPRLQRRAARQRPPPGRTTRSADGLLPHVLRQPRTRRSTIRRSRPVVATPQNDVFSVYVQDRWRSCATSPSTPAFAGRSRRSRGSDDITYINVNHFSPRVGVTWDFLEQRQVQGRTPPTASSCR